MSLKCDNIHRNWSSYEGSTDSLLAGNPEEQEQYLNSCFSKHNWLQFHFSTSLSAVSW